MRVRTEAEAWIAPPNRAVYVPAQTIHAITTRSVVEMRSLYIAPGSGDGLPARPTVLDVSGLLRELVLALLEEPLVYDETGRGGAIARLILSEIARAPRLPLAVPLRRDPRLFRVCEALLADPASPLPLEGWAETGGASARTLARLFQSKLGIGFAGWRQRVRFQNAIEAIVAGEPVARVAARNGYRSAAAFTAAFRKAFGVSPSGLRAAQAVGGSRRSISPVILPSVGATEDGQAPTSSPSGPTRYL